MSFSVHRRHTAFTATAGSIVILLAGCSGTPNHVDDVAKHSITFAVDGQGTADITWTGGIAPHATLPWNTTVQESDGAAQPPSLSVVLGQGGVQATCSIAVNGHRVASSVAEGSFGRANCRIPASSGNTQQSDG
jgi:hypothetical protein